MLPDILSRVWPALLLSGCFPWLPGSEHKLRFLCLASKASMIPSAPASRAVAPDLRSAPPCLPQGVLLPPCCLTSLTGMPAPALPCPGDRPVYPLPNPAQSTAPGLASGLTMFLHASLSSRINVRNACCVCSLPRSTVPFAARTQPVGTVVPLYPWETASGTPKDSQVPYIKWLSTVNSRDVF